MNENKNNEDEIKKKDLQEEVSEELTKSKILKEEIEDEAKMKELHEDEKNKEVSKNKDKKKNKDFNKVKKGWRYYIYTGSSSGITLKYEEEDYEIVLLTNHRIFLPENHAYTKRMIFNGFLIEN